MQKTLRILCLAFLGHGCTSDAPRDQAELAAPGRYAVVTEEVVLVDSARPTPANGTFPGAPTRTLRTSLSHPAPGSDGGPYPIIAYAHGFMSSGQMGEPFAAHLASHGYIVAAPDFPLSNGKAPGGPTLLDMDQQPGDLAFVLARVAQRADLSPDPGRQGLLGLSLGGGTALLGTYHPALLVPGIGATVVQAPLSCFFGAGLYGRSAPVLVMSGDADQIVPLLSGPQKIYDRAPAGVDLLVLRGGNHLGFVGIDKGTGANNADDLGCLLLTVPGAGDVLQQLGQRLSAGAPAGAIDASGCQMVCADKFKQTMPAERQMDLSRAATLAYFERTLRQDRGAERFLEETLPAQNDDTRFRAAARK